MKAVSKAVLATVFAFGLSAAPLVQAASEAGPGADAFVKMLDMNKDGMVSKAEYMKMMEKMFDDMDKGKKGMLDKKQTMELYRMLMSDKG